MLRQEQMLVDHIRQHPGPVQVTRRMKVRVPGKHFPGLAATEQAAFYDGTAVESAERHRAACKSLGRRAQRPGHSLRLRVGRDRRPGPQGLLDHRGALEPVAARHVQGFNLIQFDWILRVFSVGLYFY